MELAKDDSDVSDKIIKQYLSDVTVEISARTCPKILFKDFEQIFHDMPAVGCQRSLSKIKGPAVSLNEKITVMFLLLVSMWKNRKFSLS